MKTVFFALLTAASLVTSSIFAEVHKPNTPDLKSHRQEMIKKLGVKSYAIGLAATSVVDLEEFGIVVLYGAIFLKIDRSASYIFENEKAGLLCKGSSRKGLNQTQCFYKGEQVTNSRVTVEKEIYKTADGFVISPVETLDGREFGNSYTKWALFSFPDPSQLIADLQKPSN